MRRLSAVLLAAALVASLSAVALAESGPKVSGLVLLRHEAPLSPTTQALAPTHTRLRLNVSGETAAGVAYYGRVQATGTGSPTPEVYLAQAQYKLADVASLTVGRQTVAWTVLDEFSSGFPNESAAVRRGVDAVMVELPMSPATVHVAHVFAGHDTLPAEATLLHVQARLPIQGAGVTLGGLVSGSRFRDNVGFGVNGTVSLGPVTPYFEVGNDGGGAQGIGDYQFVGVKFDVLRQMAGLDTLVEYDLKGSNLFARVGRELLPGLVVSLRYKALKDKDATLTLRSDLSVSF